MPPQQLSATAVSPRRSLETISIWALCITLVAAIFVIVPSAKIPFVATKSFVLAAGALVTLAIFILARLGRGNIILPPLLLVGALWLPVLAYALSAALSGASFANSLWGLALESDTFGFMLVVAGLGTLTALILRRPEHYRLFLKIGGWAFGILALLQVLIVLGGQVTSKISPSFSMVGTYEDLALLLGLGVIATLITLRELELTERTRRMLLGSGALALVVLAIANSSLVWILLALVSLGLFVESVMLRSPKNHDADLDDIDSVSTMSAGGEEGNNRSLILPLGVLAVSLFFIIGGPLGAAIETALHVNVLNVRPSWQSTLSVAQKTYGTNPIFGSGPSTFGVQWLKYRDPSLNSSVFWNVDFNSGIGFIPTSFVTTGLLGAVAWLAMLGLLIVFGLRTLILRAPQDAYLRYVAMLSFVATVYLFTVAIFGLPNAVVLVLAFVFAGLFASTMRFASHGQQWGVIFSRSPRIGFVIVFSLTLLLLSSVVAAYSLIGHYIAAVKLTQANTAFASGAGDLDATDKAVQASISFAQSSTAYQLAAGVASTRLNQIATSQTLSKSAAQQQFQTELSTGINAALTATRLDPSNYQNWLALGQLYSQAVPLGVAGAYDSAKSAYDKAKALNPTNPQILYIIAQLDIANRNLKAAQEDLKAAITLKQDYTAAIFLLSQLEVQDGNVKDALAASLAAAYFTPNDPNILFQVGVLSAAMNDLPSATAALQKTVDVAPQFANARYFLAAVLAKQGDYPNALAQMQAISAMSADNAKAVASQITALEGGRNPFPANLLSATPVK